jgi:Ca2+-transporting ATPase
VGNKPTGTPPKSPHAFTVDEVFSSLDATPQGLNSSQAQKRLEQYGKNTIKEEKPSKTKLFLHQFANVLIYVLLIAAVITLILGELVDFALIVSLIIINSIIGFWQELKAEASIRALQKLTENKLIVLRDGKTVAIPSSDVVPGDVLLVAEGDVVTADARLFESQSIMVDEAPITGESLPVSKDSSAVLEASAMPYELENMLLTGTTVTRGRGKAVVTATGCSTYLASLAEKSKESSPDSPLTRSLRSFTQKY